MSGYLCSSPAGGEAPPGEGVFLPQALNALPRGTAPNGALGLVAVPRKQQFPRKEFPGVAPPWTW